MTVFINQLHKQLFPNTGRSGDRGTNGKKYDPIHTIPFKLFVPVNPPTGNFDTATDADAEGSNQPIGETSSLFLFIVTGVAVCVFLFILMFFIIGMCR
jgi:hypothetical protein